ncbi:conserved hypothetical tiny transmembrane protein [Bacillus sp. OV322]|nr:conserved hypothetical tiny transmembrane protein [Bacillus sp. OV322]
MAKKWVNLYCQNTYDKVLEDLSPKQNSREGFVMGDGAGIGYGGGFAFVVVLFILLIIVGCSCGGYGGYGY